MASHINSKIRIAVDCSLLAGSNGGLGRYLRALLPRMMAQAGHNAEWYLYARSAADCAALPRPARLRQDNLPAHPGRILAPATSSPYWAWRDKPDVFWAPAHRLPLWLPRETAGVVTIHDLAWLQVPETLRRSTRLLDRSLMARSVAKAARIIAVSHSTADDMATLWPNTKTRTQVIYGAAETLPPPTPLTAFAPQLKKQHYFLFVGTPEPRKNLPRLLKSYAEASRAQTNFPSLVIVGGHGWGGENLCALISQLNINSQVHRLGPVTEAQLASLYTNALSLVMPSLYEGFGLPIVEALQYGLPVLTSNSSSMPEIAGPAGLLVNPLASGSIAQGLEQITNNQKLRSKLKNAARAQASCFCWDRAAVETVTVLREAAEANRKISSRN
ncbi:glycosyltransferase family 4 protein [Gilvimarinus chinensis]|uniref:glycosyltransferase family 4 protein n=1 Tax=Gilvimarinus chinensis TaxID=396005 RepID=UPI000A055E93|nr:glycosyltransferase family 1 protein [Gilvimarinus chinensis]